MAFVCALSGEAPEVPVVSRVSGAVFEERLISKHLVDHGTDPVNNEPMTTDDLVKIHVPTLVKARAPAATSVPSLIKTFQDEWDALMLESYQLRQYVETVRQELSHALYQHDAACRVIARLTRERDQARAALANYVPSAASAAAASASAGASAAAAAPGASRGPAGLPESALAVIAATHQALSKQRKKRAKSDDLASQDALAAFVEKKAHTGLHSASKVGLCALALKGADLVLTGGNDKNAVLFDLAAEATVATLKGHTKKVSAVALHPTEDVALTGSADGTVRLWQTPTGTLLHSLSPHHAAAVTALSLHPSGELVLSAGDDQSWAISNVKTGEVLVTVHDPTTTGTTCGSFHPDGGIFALGGADGVVRVWDAKSCQSVATFEGHAGRITALAFSENGYYLATASEDKTFKIWDLRKLNNLVTVDLPFVAHALAFDYSGSYLAVGGDSCLIYTTKAWEKVADLAHGKEITGVVFGPNAAFVATTSVDRSLRVFSTA